MSLVHNFRKDFITLERGIFVHLENQYWPPARLFKFTQSAAYLALKYLRINQETNIMLKTIENGNRIDEDYPHGYLNLKDLMRANNYHFKSAHELLSLYNDAVVNLSLLKLDRQKLKRNYMKKIIMLLIKTNAPTNEVNGLCIENGLKFSVMYNFGDSEEIAVPLKAKSILENFK